jgi:hypothetical protein
MLTDDQLARELTGAFHAETDRMAFDGRVPKGPRTPMYVAPVVALAGGVTLAVIATSGSQAPRQMQVHGGPAIVVTTAPHVGPTQVKLVTRKIRLAGFTASYTQPDTADPLVARVVSAVPSPAESVQGDDPAVNYWVAQDPATGGYWGYGVLADGEVFSVGSPDATRDEIVALFQTATARAVPLVTTPVEPNDLHAKSAE